MQVEQQMTDGGELWLVGVLAGLAALWLVARVALRSRRGGVLSARVDRSPAWVKFWTGFLVLTLAGIASMQGLDLLLLLWPALELDDAAYGLVLAGAALILSVVALLLWGKHIERAIRPLVTRPDDTGGADGPADPD